MRVDIWSDLVCPWCYVGKRRFETALASIAEPGAITVVHRSFQLDPAAPRDHQTNRRDRLMRKYRLSPQQVEDLDVRMTQIAALEGLDYHLEATVSGNTADAHQLVHLAQDHAVQDAMVERLYRAYFVEGRSIFDRESLARLAGDCGLDESDAALTLQENRYAGAVTQDMETAQRLGITGVPFFVFDGKFGVSGAQTPDVFREAFERYHSVGL